MEEKKDVKSLIEGERKKQALRKAYNESGVTEEEWKVACEYLDVSSEELAVICAGQAYRCKDKSVATAMSYFVIAYKELSKGHISKAEIQNACNIYNYLYPNNNADVETLIVTCRSNSVKNKSKSLSINSRRKIRIWCILSIVLSPSPMEDVCHSQAK